MVKLDPSKLDRESAYGTPAASGETNAAALPDLLPERGEGGGAGLRPRGHVQHPEGRRRRLCGPAGYAGEGRDQRGWGNVIYGYSLRVSAAGEYRVTYVTPTVTLTGTDGGTFEAHSVSLVITVVAGGGGGGRK